MSDTKSKYDEIGMNKNTFELLFSDYDHIPKDEQINIKNSYIMTMIQTYTKFREKSIFSMLLKMYFKKRYKVDYSKIRFNEETQSYEYEFEGEIYTFNKLSDRINDKEIKKELQSEKRYHKCHSKSIDLAIDLPKADIVTGYIKSHDGRFLHSIVEIKGKNGEYTIDYTKNIIMPKEQYKKITEFEEIERISDMEYLEHIQAIETGFPEISLKVYLTFGKELVEKLKKNFTIVEDKETKERIEYIKKSS